MKPDPPRQKIAILGGGVSAITAAFELTDQPGWEEKYDITIYQLGWRLGGKCASGRNSQANDRIEEHGLHVWGGFYENAFSMMRRCYPHLGRSPDAPLATWRDAFKPHNFVALEENVNGEWKRWVQMLAANEQLPGEGHELLPLWDYVRMAMDWMLSAFNRSPHAADAETTSRPRELPAWL